MTARPDTILTGGRITTLAEDGRTPADAEAIAIGDGRVTAVGTDEEIRALAGPGATEYRLDGRRVIPGLIDGHIHALRAGRTWNDELRWENVYDLDVALELIRAEADRVPAGTWIRVVGGWHDGQFPQGRGPTRDELDAVAPHHPVYVQTRYEYAQLNTLAMERMGLDEDRAAEVEAGATRAAGNGRFERDAEGRLTGRGFGIALMSWFYRQLPVPSFEEQVASTAALSTEFARLGMTGVVDGGGVNSGPDAYGAMYEAWRRGGLKTRVRLFKHPTQDGTEREDFAGYLRFEHPHFGDGILRVSGLGEVVLWRSHDGFGVPGDISAESAEEMFEILSEAAAAGWTVQLHVHSDEFYELALEVWERVHAVHPIDGLRWTMVHAEPVQAADIPRLARLGVGVSMQSLMRLSGESAIARWGAERIAAAPPVRALLDAGIPMPLGSDAMRVANYNPFVSLQWFVTGLTVSGTPTVRGENLHSRLEALRGYTLQSAWSTFEEHERGSLEPGKLADLAVLSADYFEVPAEQIHTIVSELTLLGGEAVWDTRAVGRAAR
ncbi:amidohydrolase [Agromyces mediolanus]|uniref:amidohydrolase n=1 Tax=Agromyces mediolanus TaxID=41986 RepID=UPI0020415378|nr:amidohydrolase [Agromyces mediolanus]MCM3657789.1 amidohydrolase [Agromyces mediolanus]